MRETENWILFQMGINTLRRLDSGAIKSVSLNWHTLDMHLIQELKLSELDSMIIQAAWVWGLNVVKSVLPVSRLSTYSKRQTIGDYTNGWRFLTGCFRSANINSFLWNTFFRAWNPSSKTRDELRSSTQELNSIRVGVVQTSLLIEKRQKKKHEHRNTSVLPRRI